MNNKYLFVVISISGSLVFSFFIFYFMSQLIADNYKKKDFQKTMPIDFLRTYKEDSLETKNRILKKAPDPKPAPDKPRIKISAKNKTSNLKLNIKSLKIDQALNFKGDALFNSNFSESGSADSLPLVRIEPQYPQRARISGQEGWVELEFDVSSTGSVTNVKILASQPFNVFDSAARRAVLRWKYKPKKLKGKSVVQKGLRTKFEFKLQDAD